MVTNIQTESLMMIVLIVKKIVSDWKKLNGVNAPFSPVQFGGYYFNT